MTVIPLTRACLWTVLLALLLQAQAFGHSIAGKRFFPTTFQIDDPSPSDEFSLLAERRKLRDESGRTTTASSLDAEYAKRITGNLGITVNERYQNLQRPGDDTLRGFGNVEVSAKYQVVTSEEHEFILSLGLMDEIGDTGNARVSEDFSTVSPALFFGKGFGDLSGHASLLRPFAVTGLAAVNLPTRPTTVSVNRDTGDLETLRNPTTLSWGLSLQYSLFYLQTYVRDLGLPRPLDRMVVVIEAPMETCLNRGCDGRTTGTVNPGIVWIGKRIELGIAAEVPMNRNSGKQIGVLALFHVFLDDLFPRGIGRPLFP